MYSWLCKLATYVWQLKWIPRPKQLHRITKQCRRTIAMCGYKIQGDKNKEQSQAKLYQKLVLVFQFQKKKIQWGATRPSAFAGSATPMSRGSRYTGTSLRNVAAHNQVRHKGSEIWQENGFWVDPGIYWLRYQHGGVIYLIVLNTRGPRFQPHYSNRDFFT